MDDDGSGKLDYEEIKKGIRDYGLQMDKNQLEHLIKQIDTDESGTIDYEEFLQAVRVYK